MADKTSIEWCHATINAISGCTPVSPGCTNCYAMRAGAMHRPHHPSTGLTQPTKAGHVWTGAVRLNEAALVKPLAWRQPRRIFWNAHGDPWHESVPIEWVDREMAIAALTPQHRHLFLTKRSRGMLRYFTNPDTPERILEAAKQLGGLPTSWNWPLPNAWLGVSVEDQQRADESVYDLLQTPAAIRFLSAEPLLGPLDLTAVAYRPSFASTHFNALRRHVRQETALDWVILGGESGPRPMHPNWARSLLRQCNTARVPFLFKQWGDWLEHEVACDILGDDNPMLSDGQVRNKGKRGDLLVMDGKTFIRVGKKAAGRTLDHVIWDQYPELFPHEQLQSARSAEAVPA